MAEHPPAPQLDNLQLLLQRKAELAKTKAKFTLTEADANLLTAHASEVTFKDKEVIQKEGEDVSCVYRVKSGQVALSRHGYKFRDIGPGWFMGDNLLLTNKKSLKKPITLTANGNCVLLKLDLDYVRNLFNIDPSLSMKFYRHLATKFSATFFQILTNIDHPSLTAPDSDAAFEPYEAPKGLSFIDQRVHEKSHSNLSILYKVYPLTGTKHGLHTLELKSKKIKIMSKMFGAHTKNRIPLEKVENIAKVGNDGVTITFHKKNVTVHFKNPADRDEFVGIATGLLPNPGSIPKSPTVSVSPTTEEDPDKHEPLLSESDLELYHSINKEEHYKKGDKIFEEGDLLQRVYTFTSGTINVMQNGALLRQVMPGDIIGVGTLLILRPSVVTLEVASDTATALVIPAYKIFGLMETHPSVANRIFKNAAQILDRQTNQALAEFDARRNAKEAPK
eukprot:Phypoly_transcript_09562.p1 GENE.Phypoly_transcript_09562~~Phypoly_transcript_09562.p1  ORF type:complete len:462 (+),score=75.94 Phypoly_transcript_09562:45-1388(+)